MKILNTFHSLPLQNLIFPKGLRIFLSIHFLLFTEAGVIDLNNAIVDVVVETANYAKNLECKKWV